ncbi:membrane protein [Streptomonospora sediminis]
MSDPAARSGPGRVLVAIYAIFAIGATSRAAVQILTRFGEAPLAYVLSALAGVVYIVATVGLVGGSRASLRVAAVSCAVELAGVLVVGAVSVFDPAAFPDDTVWSRFGSGYLFIPLVLPVVGLLWLRHVHRSRQAANPA